MAALLSIRDLTVIYHNNDVKVKAVDSISLDINKGESLGIVGESGSGKSTLIMAALKLLPQKTSTTCGNVIYDDRNLLELSREELAKIRWVDIAVVFQKSMNILSPVHTIGTFLTDIYRIHVPKASKQEAREKVCSVLQMVNLAPRIFRMYPHELSGGMMQRVSIAMSLMFQPKILIMDEATTALDVITQTQILSEITALEQKFDLTRIMITHDMSVVASSCKKVAVLYAGKLVETGPVQEVLVSPKHPYTIGLINSYPKFTPDGEAVMESIGGTLPNLSQEPEGCNFRDRCRYATDICRKKVPLCVSCGTGWNCACHHAGRLGGGQNV